MRASAEFEVRRPPPSVRRGAACARCRPGCDRSGTARPRAGPRARHGSTHRGACPGGRLRFRPLPPRSHRHGVRPGRGGGVRRRVAGRCRGGTAMLRARRWRPCRRGLVPAGTSLRGASLWDRQDGTRWEPDPTRGVRTSRFDYSEAGARAIDDALAAQGLTHFRTREALAVATKTLWAGVAAELCWSDEPDYTTGYVSTPRQRATSASPTSSPTAPPGAAIFFLDTTAPTLTCASGAWNGSMSFSSRPPVSAPPVHAAEFGR